MAAHQAPPSLGFSRKEQWSGLPFPSPMHESEKWKWSHSVLSDSSRPHGLQPTRLLCPWDFPGKSTGVGCHCLNQPWVYMYSPSWTCLPPPSPSHPSGSSQCTSHEHPVSFIEPGLAICFTYDNIHASMLFSQIIPPLPSPTESKRLFSTCISFAVSHIGLLLPSF